MLRRTNDAAGVLAIGQPSHAWLCGQFARAWGNARFGEVVPGEEVALAAEQHDIGMARWDLDPGRNPETGLPQSFTEMGAQASVKLWHAGPVTLTSQSRYAALLAAMHGRRLYERRATHSAPAPEAEAIEAFLAHSRELEAGLTASLRADPATAPHATPKLIARNSQLVWTWDTLSLALLLDWAPRTVTDVPAAGGTVLDVALRTVWERDGTPVATLDPWPFADPAGVAVHCEGRRLTGRFHSDAALAEGLASAPWETVTFLLMPA